MLKVFLVSALMMAIVLVVTWAFMKLQDKAKARRNQTKDLIDAIAANHKKTEEALDRINEKLGKK